ncbi:hypothetical protein CLAIMM_14194 isoform 3, partial [Cladophialophora immunda]
MLAVARMLKRVALTPRLKMGRDLEHQACWRQENGDPRECHGPCQRDKGVDWDIVNSHLFALDRPVPPTHRQRSIQLVPFMQEVTAAERADVLFTSFRRTRNIPSPLQGVQNHSRVEKELRPVS